MSDWAKWSELEIGKWTENIQLSESNSEFDIQLGDIKSNTSKWSYITEDLLLERLYITVVTYIIFYLM